jgi:predicted metal-dependent phosphoesterase TrpH
MVDMHIHTKYSDGDYTIPEIINKLKEKNIKLFSITDHDNINSCYEMENIKLENMTYIPGIEFSSKLNNIKCHILGYNIDYKNPIIQKECNKIKLRRINKIVKLVRHLTENGIEITEEEFNNILYKNGTFGKIDICRILMKKGYGKKEEIYDKYLEIPLPNHRSNASEIIKTIKQANGISVLAHPKEIEEEYRINIDDIIRKYIELGIDGIEIYNSIHTLKDVKRYIEIAKKYNLITTGGSDFHGSSHPERILGTTTTKQKILKINQINYCSKK